jgi:hypothetical protein
MNASTMRGFAVLALLCLLPRASALTIVQTFSNSGGDGLPWGGTLRVGDTRFYDQFAVPGGSLMSVDINAQITATLSVTELNPFNDPTHERFGPYAWDASTNVFSWFYLRDESDDGMFFQDFAFSMLAAPPQLIPPGAYANFTGTISQQYTHTFSQVADLAAFTGEERGRLIFSTTTSAESIYGTGGNLSADTTIVLTYTYGVPDATPSLALLGLAVLPMIVLRRFTARS